jgi:ketosteroid isomerase-like protein
MPQTNIELVRNWFERWNAGEREFSDDEIDPEAVVVSRFFASPQHGLEGARLWLREIDDYFKRWKIIGNRWIEDGDRVGVLGEIELQGRESGVAFSQPCGWVFELRDGRLTYLETFLDDPAAKLEAAGFALE